MLNCAKLEYDSFRQLLSEIGAACPDTYVNSPLYYMLTGRRGAWVYRSGRQCLIVCRHPHLDRCLMVFPELGRDPDYALTARILTKLGATGLDVRLSRYSQENIDTLAHQLTKRNSSAAIGITVCGEEIMDWKYPVRILDTRRVASMEGASFAKIRNKCRRAAGDVIVSPLRGEDMIRPLRATLRFWEGNMILERKDTEDMSELYAALFDLMSDRKTEIEGLYSQRGRRPVGFSLWERSALGVANLFVNLCDTSITGLSDFQLVSSCRHLVEQGVDHLNMGGSELESLDAFKAKFQPIKSISILSAVVSYASHAGWPGLELHTLVDPVHQEGAAMPAVDRGSSGPGQTPAFLAGL